MKHLLFSSLMVGLFLTSGCASSPKTGDKANEIVKWNGTVKCQDSSLSSSHPHYADFVREDNGESYDVVDSPEFVKTFCGTGKVQLVQIEAERTASFLLWGDNLIVKNYSVLQDLDKSSVHGAPRTGRFPRGGPR